MDFLQRAKRSIERANRPHKKLPTRRQIVIGGDADPADFMAAAEQQSFRTYSDGFEYQPPVRLKDL